MDTEGCSEDECQGCFFTHQLVSREQKPINLAKPLKEEDDEGNESRKVERVLTGAEGCSDLRVSIDFFKKLGRIDLECDVQESTEFISEMANLLICPHTLNTNGTYLTRIDRRTLHVQKFFEKDHWCDKSLKSTCGVTMCQPQGPFM